MACASNAEWDLHYGNTISKDFKEFYNTTSFSDITLIVEDAEGNRTRIPAHKIILSARSWDFYVTFRHLKLDNDEVIVQDVNIVSFMGLLEFCYQGNLELEGKDVWDILKLANRFDVKKLIELCENFLKGKLDRDTCIDFYVRDTLLGITSPLRKMILENVVKEIEHISNSPELLEVFVNLPRDKLKDIAKAELLRYDEMELFRVVMKWAAYNCAKIGVPSVPRNMRSVLGEVFWEIRFPTMKMEWICDIQENYPRFLRTDEISSIFKFMNKKVSTCVGFKCQLRAYNAPLKDPLARYCSPLYKPISCFTDSPQRTKRFCTEMSVEFVIQSAAELVGIGYFVKSNTRPIPESIELIKSDLRWVSPVTFSFALQESKSQKLSIDFDFIEVHFQQYHLLSCDTLYILQCKFGEEVPMLLTVPKNYNSNPQIFLKTDENVPIPYLLFRN